MELKDRELLNLIQDNFPIESRPFLVLANRLNVTEEEVIERIKNLKKNGYIRRLGGNFESRKLGYFSTLCTIRVPEDRIEEVAEIINSLNGVTHNYIREHSYNMWFTMIASSIEKIQENLEAIKVKTGIDDIMNLPMIKSFKLRVNFDLKEVKRDV